MGQPLTEIQQVPQATTTGRMVKFARATMADQVQIFNTDYTLVAQPGDYVIDAGDIGFDVMTPECFQQNYAVKDFNEDTQTGTAEFLDNRVSL